MTIAFFSRSFQCDQHHYSIPIHWSFGILCNELIPGEDEVVKYEPLYLDENLITQAPSIALGNAKKSCFI